ncbi:MULTISPECIES: 23S rRNA (pseudouridine(1915)-N(3))-methyltransferase RlmH [unclassified Paracoccus (in: a-proteobacteria)]|uniref:23S rRNA (pseudouridine(1915)-N(3))-methyltransferase RlmH n=1 Tax=unclassified Paracoccus (in: a-proteobacteria) TaxID=2688777 RepID=UPI0012B35060|nr:MULTISPECIES: 23S rRNA (pseudouridine(1915)-N(3))-methyltransferase RlmH [unclassified Paracoccus (in: a-proteobacteria)]UXU75993.1 23S rRNA (pseudouridine(1915)-N(3))-methyltransferase RlmH [Paracoccus sp. SMMA_5]UXU81902.1 23S rRNA (pseudouridine(1915)-N(3))-methyltransferase RlmH [Paracoccus sp. SMMA_5_TC]
MRMVIAAVGRLRQGPESSLIADYLDRHAKAGRALGLPPVQVVEVEDRRGGGMAAEAALLARAIPEGAALVVLDERGQQLTSPEFAARIGAWRDQARDIAFVIGGADGIEPALRGRADLAISFGRMVWPHMLVRVMLAEQIYRATTILSGSPYHRL